MNILVTGANGTLGSELVKELCQLGDVHKIYAIFRKSNSESAQSKFEKFKTLLLDVRNVSPFCIDKLILIEHDLRFQVNLPSDLKIEKIYHCAANTRLDPSLQEARQNNLWPMLAVIRIALKAKSELIYISTAFANHKTGFRNNYERSKYECEIALKKSGIEKYLIIKPSLIIGDDRDGYSYDFRIFFSLIKIWKIFGLKYIPVPKNSFVYVCPINKLIKTMIEEPCEKQTITTSSPAIKSWGIINAAAEVMEIPYPIPAPKFIAFLLKRTWIDRIVSKNMKDILYLCRGHMAYLSLNDNIISGEIGVNDAIQKSLEYAKKTHWGKVR